MTYYTLTPGLPAWLTLLIVVALVLGATVRLTRVITTDSLGEWVLRSPLTKWATRAETLRRQAWSDVIEQMSVSDIELDEGAAQLILEKSEELRSDSKWLSWQGKLVSGLYCPFCVGFWIGVIVVAITGALSWSWAPTWLAALWLFALVVLTLNYIIGHISARLD